MNPFIPSNPDRFAVAQFHGLSDANYLSPLHRDVQKDRAKQAVAAQKRRWPTPPQEVEWVNRLLNHAKGSA